MNIKTAGLLVCTLLTASSQVQGFSGISCMSDGDCGNWNYGEYFQCNVHSYCDAGTRMDCVSQYYCSLSCTNGVCNNMFHVCDGDCSAMPGMCDSSTCGGEVCTAGGVCGPTCGDGNCDPGEDNANCPADCPAATSTVSTTVTTSVSTTATVSATTSTMSSTSTPTSTFTPTPSGPGYIELIGRSAR